MTLLTAQFCKTTKPHASEWSVVSRAWFLSTVLKVEVLLLEVELLPLVEASVEAATATLAFLEVLTTVIPPALLLV